MGRTCKSIAARKQKGRKLQQNTRNLILETFKNKLEPDDVKSTSMGAAGVDVQLSPTAQKLFPFAIECKNSEGLNIYRALDQAISNSTEKLKPAVIFKKNRTKTYIAIEFEEFLHLIKENNILKENKI